MLILARALFEAGPIEILVVQIGKTEVKLTIEAHPDLVILGNELFDSSSGPGDDPGR